jgi:hypothetical protein
MEIQNMQTLDRYYSDLDEHKVQNISRRSKRLKTVDPFLQWLGWPLRTPTKDIEVNLSQTFGDRKIDYLLTRNEKPLIALEIVNEDGEFNLYNEIPESCLGYIVTNGFWFEFNVITETGLLKVDETNILDLDLKEATSDTFSFDGVSSELIDSVVSQYGQLSRDKEVIDSEESEIQDEIAGLIEHRISSLSREEISEGSSRMIDFLERQIESKEFADVVDQIKAGKSSTIKNSDNSSIGDEDVVLIVQQSRDNINERVNNAGPSEAKIVTYTDTEPDYIAFYIKESDSIEYVSEINSYELLETKDTESEANRVYAIKSSQIREIDNKIISEDDSMNVIEYCLGSEIKNAEKLEDIEML